MKKLNELQSYLTRLRGLMLTLIILCSIGSGNVWGATYTYDFSTVASKWYTNSTHTTTAGTGSGNNYTTIYYTDGTTWTASGTNHYFNSGYYMLGKTGAALNLPTYSGEKITQVKLHGSGGHSTSVSVNIYTTGGTAASTAQTWSTTGKDHTYSIGSDYQSSALRVQVTNNYNTQFTQIVITTEASGGGGDCNAIDVTGGSAVILPAGSTTYSGGDWEDAGAPTAYPSSTTEYSIGTGSYCVTLTKVADYSRNSNGLQFQASNGVLLIEDITSNSGVDVEIQISSGSGFSIALTGAETLTSQSSGIKTISTTSTSANLTISKPTSGAGYIKYIKVTPKAAACSADPTVGAASLNGPVSLSGATVRCANGITNIGGTGCSLTGYGFVVGTSSTPIIGGTGVTKHEVGTTIAASTAFEKALTLSAGTYYVRPYATNGHGTGYGTQYTLVIPSLSSIAITTAPARTAYLQGETFDPTGAVVTATYSNSTTADVTESVTWSPTTLSSTGSQTMTAIYSGKTATTTVTVYSVTLQAKDEDGNDIPAGGPGAPSFNAATRGISPAADAANYGWWKWEVTNATLGSAITTKNNTISSPTGDVVITAKYRNPRTVTWMVNGVEWTPSESGGADGTAVVKYGSAWSTLTLPTDPTTSDGCGDKFVGWVATPISGKQADDTGLDIMTSANKSDKTGAGHNVNDNITFHAVFADYLE